MAAQTQKAYTPVFNKKRLQKKNKKYTKTNLKIQIRKTTVCVAFSRRIAKKNCLLSAKIK